MTDATRRLAKAFEDTAVRPTERSARHDGQPEPESIDYSTLESRMMAAYASLRDLNGEVKSTGSRTGRFKSVPEMQAPPGSFHGVRIVVSEHALEETDVPLFPVNPDRKPRVQKKLLKRFGSQFKRVPCIWTTADGGIVCHPSMYEQLKRRVSR